MLVCDKCKGKINEGSKFCPHCGDPVTQSDKPDASLVESQVASVEIKFGFSTSASYERAVDICKIIPTYEQSGEGKGSLHSITVPITEIELILNIYKLVGSWKSSKMLINGQPASKSALVYHGVGCYRERQKAYDRDQYCFGEREYELNIWGCKKLNLPLAQWGGGWLEYGKFDSKGVWHFDKDRIRHELLRRIHENELCPVLNQQRVLQTLDAIPNSIDPKRDPRWEYRTSIEGYGDSYKEVAAGIKPVLSEASCFVIGEFTPSWNDFSTSNDQDAEAVVEEEVPVYVQEQTEPAIKRGSSRSCLGTVLLIICVFLIIYYLLF
ncbi:MAG: zinc ribbon domain-containing protein [candidate division Zixibacteria bacterium]|nr:zinc ribbon domain-containing protein [candidate division Zixibacteria bacterium]